MSQPAPILPNDYAASIGMSRTHLRILIDRGELPTVRIDGVIHLDPAGLPAFEDRLARERAELAWAFAHQDQLREAAIEELARHL